jgi:transcriptional regulator GlxA family with amidase domain
MWCSMQWVVDGNLWTATGAITGMDMIAHWIQQNYGKEVMIQGASGLDFEPRHIDGTFGVLGEREDDSGKKTNGHIYP